MSMVLKEDPKEGIISAKFRSSSLLILDELKAAEALVSCISILSYTAVAATDTTSLCHGGSLTLTLFWRSFGES